MAMKLLFTSYAGTDGKFIRETSIYNFLRVVIPFILPATYLRLLLPFSPFFWK